MGRPLRLRSAPRAAGGGARPPVTVAPSPPPPKPPPAHTRGGTRRRFCCQPIADGARFVWPAPARRAVSARGCHPPLPPLNQSPMATAIPPQRRPTKPSRQRSRRGDRRRRRHHPPPSPRGSLAADALRSRQRQSRAAAIDDGDCDYTTTSPLSPHVLAGLRHHTAGSGGATVDGRRLPPPSTLPPPPSAPLRRACGRRRDHSRCGGGGGYWPTRPLTAPPHLRTSASRARPKPFRCRPPAATTPRHCGGSVPPTSLKAMAARHGTAGHRSRRGHLTHVSGACSRDHPHPTAPLAHRRDLPFLLSICIVCLLPLPVAPQLTTGTRQTAPPHAPRTPCISVRVAWHAQRGPTLVSRVRWKQRGWCKGATT